MVEPSVISTKCPVCGCTVIDETGGKVVPLCSEECERVFSGGVAPEQIAPERMNSLADRDDERFGYDGDCGGDR